jgi:DNA-binding MarR family transcriptional regulator
MITGKNQSMKDIYFETIMLIERLHHLFLDVIKIELDRLHIADINNVQCFILYNVGKSEMTVGEIANRGYYLGSNVSYNLKKLVQNGYFIQKQAAHDKRASKISLSEKGLRLYEKINKLFGAHADNLKHNKLSQQTMSETIATLRNLESYWNFILTRGSRR